MPLDHIGINVADIAATQEYYDALAPLVGFTPAWSGDDWVAYAPVGGDGTQVFFYTTEAEVPYSRHSTGLQHLGFRVESRAAVDTAHAWAAERGNEVLHAPRLFPEYHPDHYATFWVDPRGFKIEVVSFVSP
jgi:catechol 2,3-dioxygenase-like lactoylglutathione lyase family enzyme